MKLPRLSPRFRKLSLTLHVVASVGWLGAVVGFLALSVAGWRGQDPMTVRAVYLSMNLLGQWVVVPLSIAALVTGLIQSFGTEWGLFRYWWVTVKFVLTLVAASLLMLHQFTAVAVAAEKVATFPFGEIPQVGPLGFQLVIDAALGVFVLFAITAISIFKPWGLIRFQPVSESSNRESATLFARRIVVVLLIVLGMVFAVLHLMNGIFHLHRH